MEKKIHRLGKSIFLSGAVLASAMLAGCSQEAGSVLRGFNGSGDDVQVSVSFADADKASSRAADGLDTSTSGFGNENAGVCIKADNQTAGNLSSYTAFSYAVASGGKSITAPNEGPKFPSGVNSVNVYGWYPYNNGSTSFTVQGNQQTAANYCLSDLMLADKAVCTRNASTGVVEQAASLTFRHVLSKVKVNLSLDADVTVSGVTLKSILPSVTIDESDPASLTVGSASGDATDITLLSNGSLTSSSPAADLTLCGVFPGQDKSGALLAVTASYNGGSAQTITYSLGSAKTFAGGKEYTMNISLEGTDITTGTVSIGDWDTPNGTVNIGHGALALSTNTQELEAGGSNGTVTVNDNTVSNITVASANPSVATAAVSTNTVTITPVAAGTTQLIVSAEKNGMKLFGVIDVTVAASMPTLATITAADVSNNKGTASNPRAWVICSNGDLHLCQAGREVSPSSDPASPVYIDNSNTTGLSCSGKKVAVVCYVGSVGGVDKSTTVDASGYHGLAIAIEDCNDYNAEATLLIFSADQQSTSTLCVASTNDIPTALQADDQWWMGIDYTNQMAGGTGNCVGHTHTAVSAAKNYASGPNSSSENYSHDVPSGCSQWFLPTLAQWNLIVKGLVGGSTDLSGTGNSDYSASAINQYLFTAGGGVGVESSPYAVSTFAGTMMSYSLVWGIDLSTGSVNSGMSNSAFYVRPVIAF